MKKQDEVVIEDGDEYSSSKGPGSYYEIVIAQIARCSQEGSKPIFVYKPEGKFNQGEVFINAVEILGCLISKEGKEKFKKKVDRVEERIGEIKRAGEEIMRGNVNQDSVEDEFTTKLVRVYRNKFALYIEMLQEDNFGQELSAR